MAFPGQGQAPTPLPGNLPPMAMPGCPTPFGIRPQLLNATQQQQQMMQLQILQQQMQAKASMPGAPTPGAGPTQVPVLGSPTPLQSSHVPKMGAPTSHLSMMGTSPSSSQSAPSHGTMQAQTVHDPNNAYFNDPVLKVPPEFNTGNPDLHDSNQVHGLPLPKVVVSTTASLANRSAGKRWPELRLADFVSGPDGLSLSGWLPRLIMGGQVTQKKVDSKLI